MLSIDKLKEFGADTSKGLGRCVNNEALYLRLVAMVPKNDSFAKLNQAINANNLEEAFSASHSLKGILSNLELTPLLEPVLEITERLRNKENCDYSIYLDEINKKRQELEKMCE